MAARRGRRPVLSGLDIALGLPVGMDRVERLARNDAPPARALEAACLAALRGPGRCVVGFSGGRDSSLVLAAATAMARRTGLPAPVALTLRFPDEPRSDESAWQERVIAHLGLADWERIELAAELDLLGPRATGLLERIGPYWPPNAHFAHRLAEAAAGGTLLTGEGGDDLYLGWPLRRNVLVRRRSARARVRAGVPAWLTAAGQRRWVDETARLWAGGPARWDRRLAWIRAQRHVSVTVATNRRAAADAGAGYGAPLLDARFLGALAQTRGLRSRTAALTTLFGDLLPRAILERETKATFDRAFWGPAARAFAQTWDGPVDAELVDARRLRQAWLEAVDFRSATLLQNAWARNLVRRELRP